jgi:hypothetical protein
MASYPQTGIISTGIYTGLWADEREFNYRMGIAKMYPNGAMPLTALTSAAPAEKLTDPQFYWWDQDFPDQTVAVVGIYTNQAASTTYSGAGAVGTTLQVTFTDDLNHSYSNHLRSGQVVMLYSSTNIDIMCRALILSVSRDVASLTSRVDVKLLEADTTAASYATVANGLDLLKVIGNANPEGSERPDSIFYRPTKMTNYSQIFRNSWDITRTAENTKLRTEDAKKRDKADALELHGTDMEKACLFGIPYETIGSNGLPLRTTGGWFYYIKQYASSNIFNYKTDTDTDFAGKTWLQAGRTWMNTCLEAVFRYGRSEKMCVCGSGVVLGINALAQELGTYNISEKTIAFGTKVLQWITPYGVIYLKTHPLFSYDSSFRNTALIIEPQNMKWRFITDTMVNEVKSNGSKDGSEGDFLTEGGFEFHFPKTAAILYNVGINNVVTA